MRVSLVLFGVFYAVSASAGVYKCTDSNGNTSYQTKACDVEVNAAALNLKSGSATDLEEIRKAEALEKAKHQEQHRQKVLEMMLLAQQQEQLNIDTINEGAKNQELIKNNPQHYSAYAIPPYSGNNSPVLVGSFADRLPEIERFRRKAAQLALAQGQCDRVEASELNIKSTQDNLVFLVDCSNAQRLYFEEANLSALP